MAVVVAPGQLRLSLDGQVKRLPLVRPGEGTGSRLADRE
jgi:hypothetical protein